MAHYRVSIAFQLDSALPRDAVSIHPHYQGDNPQALADAIKTNLLANADIGPTFPFTIKVYDATKPPPNFPLYTTTNGTGFKGTGGPRELALCLSFYATVNRPRWRGRVYLPNALLGGLAPGLRPNATQMNKALTFRTVLTNGLPEGTFQEVWSKTDGNGHGVTNYWVDDEWDIVRSRGLKGTTRVVSP